MVKSFRAAHGNKKKKIDIDQLQKKDIKEKFKTELRNRFAVLQGKAVEINNNEPTLEKKWENIKTVYNETAKKVLGYKNKQCKKWIRDDTWRKIEERRQIKAKINNARSERLKEQLQTKYSIKNKEVKKSARQDRKVYYEELASEAEEAARRREIGTVYKITKELAGKGRAHDRPIKSKAGERLTTERQQMDRWIEHFNEVLNIESDTGELLFVAKHMGGELNINLEEISINNFKSALQHLKNRKSPGVDEITAEVLKVDTETTATVFHSLFQHIWKHEAIPADWAKGIIIKLPKKVI